LLAYLHNKYPDVKKGKGEKGKPLPLITSFIDLALERGEKGKGGNFIYLSPYRV